MKLLKKLSFALLAVVLGFCMVTTSCSKDDDDDSLSNQEKLSGKTWEMAGTRILNVNYNLVKFMEYFKGENNGDEAPKLSITLNSDGTATISGAENSVSTWQLNEDQTEITFSALGNSDFARYFGLNKEKTFEINGCSEEEFGIKFYYDFQKEGESSSLKLPLTLLFSAVK